MDEVKRWIEDSPYAAALGVVCEELDAERARLRLPFHEGNANPGRALHGGAAASLAAIGGQAVARAVLGPEAAPWHSAGLQVSYLAAAIGEDVVAEARLLRRGKQMCFVEVDVATPGGRAIAHASTLVRGRFGAPPAALAEAVGDDGLVEPGPMGPLIEKLPLMARCGIHVVRMEGGRSRLVLPDRDANLDAGGGLHEGALLALFDTTGAMAAWAAVGPGPHKASTPALQAQILAPLPRETLVACAHVAARDGELFWCDVEVAGADSAQVVARGTVIYRIVTAGGA